MVNFRAGILAALLIACAPLPVAAQGHLVAKALGARGDRFIEMPESAAGKRYANVGAQIAIVYGEAGIEVSPARASLSKSGGAASLRYAFDSARTIAPEGAIDSGITYNFLVGDRKGWATGLHSFARVRYRGLWPGIDATYSGDASGIKYHFDVAAGSEPARIAFVVRGADDARIASDGAVEWTVAGKVLRDESPVAFQSSGGVDALVAVKFVLEKAGDGAWRLGFDLGKYDRSKALTVDPAWPAAAGLVGGNASDQVFGVARDAAGNTYACGVTASSNLPAFAAYRATSYGDDDAFLVKFNAAGQPQFVTYFGGTGFDVCTGIALHTDNTIYITGGTTSMDFPLTAGGSANLRHATTPGIRDAFVAKFSAAGNTLVYSGVFGGSGDDQANAIALDTAGRAYLTGYTSSSDFPGVVGPKLTRTGSMDAFVTRVAAGGGSLEYSGFIGGNGSVQAGRGIAVDASAVAYVVGETNATATLPSMAGTFRTLPGSGDGDAFVAKIDATGNFSFFTILTGVATTLSTGLQTGADRALGVAIDSDATILVVGETDSTNFPANDAGTRVGVISGPGIQAAPSGNMDGFVVRMSATGSAVSAATYLGGTHFDSVEAVALDGAGGVYVAGTSANPLGAGAGTNGFPTLATSGLATANLGLQDGFLARILGAAPAYSGFVGSNANDAMHAIATGTDKILFLGGATSGSSASFTGANTTALATVATAPNGVVLRINPFGAAKAIVVIGGTPQSAGVSTPFPTPLQVKVIDQDGLAVPGASVLFTPPGSGASATIAAPNPVTTDAAGLAQALATANAAAGAYNVVASTSGAPSVNFALTNSAATSVGKRRFDFNNDGKSDVLFRRGSDGANYVWQLNGLAISSQGLLPGVPANWSVAGIGDFNGDGNADILWRDAATGQNYVWHLSGVFSGGVMGIVSQGVLPSVDSSWVVAGIGDFNGDGKSDILWRRSDGANYVWHVNGAVITGGVLAISSQGLLPNADPSWSVAAIGDFNGDGKSDILWRNTDKSTYVWHVDGATISGGVLAISSQGALPSVDATWIVAGTGDYNGDGKSDVFWRRNDGQNYVWHLDGTVITAGSLSISSQGALPLVDTSWVVAGSGDYDGDGKSDVYWRQASSGTNYLWFVNGAVITAGALSIPAQGQLPSVDNTWSVPNPK